MSCAGTGTRVESGSVRAECGPCLLVSIANRLVSESRVGCLGDKAAFTGALEIGMDAKDRVKWSPGSAWYRINPGEGIGVENRWIVRG